MINLKQDDVECYNLKNRADRLKGLVDSINSMFINPEIKLSDEEINYADKAFDIVLIHLGKVDRLLNKGFDKTRENNTQC